MKRFLYNPPGIIKWVFNNVIWNTRNKKILLTFDDGPIPETTEIILNLLKENNIRAAFFCVGNNIDKYPALAEKIISGGHLIGNHTFNHKTPSKISKSLLVKEIEEFNKVTYDKLRFVPEYFRPPHGRFDLKTFSVLNQFNLKNVMWSLLTFDYKNDINIVKFGIENFLNNNSLVVFHDSLKSSKIICDSINLIVKVAYEKGYEFGVPEECLK